MPKTKTNPAEIEALRVALRALKEAGAFDLVHQVATRLYALTH